VSLITTHRDNALTTIPPAAPAARREGGTMQLRKRLTYANVVSTLAVFLFLTTGTAYATHLIVNSSDVVDESLVSADLKNGSAVKSADVVNDNLTGADIREGTLGQVPAATLGGLGRSAASTDRCQSGGPAFTRCIQVQLNLPSPGRVLLTGRITAEHAASVAWEPACRWAGVQESGWLGPANIPGATTRYDIPMVGLTNVLPAGQGYTFAIECFTDQFISFTDAWVTAVAISPS
jgi:hypothetical protein